MKPYETISGPAAKPLFEALGQSETGDNYFTEVRRHDGEIAVSVHGQPGFKTLTYGNGEISLSEIAGGWQTLTTVSASGAVQVTQQAWNSQQGLNGPVTVATVNDAEKRRESLTAMRGAVGATLGAYELVQQTDKGRTPVQEAAALDSIPNVPAKTSGKALQ